MVIIPFPDTLSTLRSGITRRCFLWRWDQWAPATTRFSIPKSLRLRRTSLMLSDSLGAWIRCNRRMLPFKWLRIRFLRDFQKSSVRMLALPSPKMLIFGNISRLVGQEYLRNGTMILFGLFQNLLKILYILLQSY
jgi:hypothetical protein